jgi:hypothetical protein
VSTILYTVRCEFTDPAVADAWLQWLADEHLADVCDAGALDAEAVRLDGDPVTCEVHYHFADRVAFETYERDHAPALREEGLSRFPLELGLSYRRSVGEVTSATGSP